MKWTMSAAVAALGMFAVTPAVAGGEGYEKDPEATEEMGAMEEGEDIETRDLEEPGQMETEIEVETRDMPESAEKEEKKEQETRELQEPSQPMLAMRHISVVNAGIQGAAANAAMLSALAEEPQAYERSHGRLLLKNVRAGVKDAQEHAGHLASVAEGTPVAQDVSRIQQELQQVDDRAKDARKKLKTAEEVKADASAIHDQLMTSVQSLEQVSQQLQAPISLETQGAQQQQQPQSAPTEMAPTE